MGIMSEVLGIIEEQKGDRLSIEMLANSAFISRAHLQRLFSQLTGQSLIKYARGRRLAHSLEALLKSNMRIIDIAGEYGFEHEQSYIRAFKKEFGCTPNEARKNKRILLVRERISPENLYDMEKGILYGPEHVMVPSFHMIGKPVTFRAFNYGRDALLPNIISQESYYEVRSAVKSVIHPEVVLGLCTFLEEVLDKSRWNEKGNFEYMPGIEVQDLRHVPDGMRGFTFPALHCVRFRYVGRHHYKEISMVTATDTYAAIRSFFHGQTRYIQNRHYHLERTDTRLYDGEFCQFELLIPIEDTFFSK